MKYDTIKGLDKKISKLILGNDNQTEYDSAAELVLISFCPNP
jgi:hypothetical protein